MSAETIKCRHVEVAHNTERWEVCTNRHTSTRGNAWGWIEGAPGNVCWSNDGPFNHTAASAVVRVHNEWLERQRPIDIRINEARQKLDAAKVASGAAERAHNEALNAESLLRHILDNLIFDKEMEESEKEAR